MGNVRQLTIRQRAWITLGLILGFYAFALAMAGGLAAIPVLQWLGTRTVSAAIAVPCLLASLGLVVSVLPRRDRFEPPGPLLERSSQPRLFAEIDRVASDMRQAAPEEVYLVPDINAFVAERGGLLGWGSRRIMGLGLPLLQMLSVSQFRAVLAHEYGHYAGDDTRLGPWLYKAREDMGRTLESFEEGSLVGLAVDAYGRLFMWVTQAFSREQEYAADLWAASLYGRKAIAEGLQAVDWGARCYDLYWRSEVSPLLESGHLPPVAEGFARFGCSSFADQVLKENESPPEADPYDSHPALQERLAALVGLPESESPPDDSSAVTLLDDPAGLEALMIKTVVDPERLRSLQRIRWEDAGTQVYLPQWLTLAKEQSEALAGVTLSGLAKTLEDWGWFVHRFKGLPEELTEEESREICESVVGAAVGAALHADGWSVKALPGEDILCVKEGREVAPFRSVRRLMNRELKAKDWKALCDASGAGALELGAAKTRARPAPGTPGAPGFPRL